MIADNDPIKEIATIVAVVANDNTLSVKLEESNPLGTSFIDYKEKRISVCDKCIPKVYRGHPQLVRYFRLGLAQHEAQHWAFTREIVKEYQQWVDTRRYPGLARIVRNVVEDYRVNTWLEETYALDIGSRITWLKKAMYKAWKPTMAKVLKRAVKEDDKQFLENPVNFIIHGVVNCGLYGAEVDEHVNEWSMWTGYFPPENAVKAINEIIEVTHNSIYDSQDTVFESWQRVYRICEAFTREQWEKDKDGNVKGKPRYVHEPGGDGVDIQKIPIHLGGGQEVDGGKLDPKLLEDVKDLDDSQGDVYQARAGKGSGTEAPTPPPNEGEYHNLIMRNLPYTTALLNKLKTLMQPRIETLKYQRSGRLMTKHLGKYITSRRPVENLYSRKKYTLEKQKVALTLVVDLSGSMNTQDAKDVLTVISEVGGQWLDDRDLSVFVFGSSFQKIKTFNEPYRQTRARIGGVRNLGGTMLADCLRCVHRMYRGSVNGRQKVCVIVSDFCLGDHDQSMKEIQAMQKDGIEFIGVGMCASDLESVKEFTKSNSTYLQNVSQLPQLFYEIYRKTTMMQG